VVRVFGPDIANATVPRLFDCVTGSSLIRFFSHWACVAGSAWICRAQMIDRARAG
jgi:hypothetical protein